MMSTGRTRPWRGLVEWVAPAACGALIGALLDGLNRLISAMG